MVDAQDGAWNILFHPVAALVFLICVFAETNRHPFDMPESETDLVGGFHTEYGAFKFGIFFVAEYSHMIIGSTLFILMFLGGWHVLPWMPTVGEGWIGSLVGVATFFLKLCFFLFFFVWVRWTIPRFRYDQVMRLAELAEAAGLDGIVCSGHEVGAVHKQWKQGFFVVPGLRPAIGSSADQKRTVTPREARDAGASVLFTTEDPVRWGETYLVEGNGDPYRVFDYQRPSARAWRQGPVLAGEVWAENIPFEETRDYVKKVLANTTHYASLITGQPQSLRARLGVVGPPVRADGYNRDLP